MVLRLKKTFFFINLFLFFFNYLSFNIYIYLLTELFWLSQFFNITFLQKMYFFIGNFIYKKLNVFFSFLQCYLFNNFFKLILNLIIFKYIFCGVTFLRYRFFLKIGLGFKKKLSRILKEYILFFGYRHWIIFNLFDVSFYFNIRKKNIILFMPTKNLLNKYIGITKFLRKETVFKTKGLMFTRVWIRKRLPRAILFARRVKFCIVKSKLSKKQKFL